MKVGVTLAVRRESFGGFFDFAGCEVEEEEENQEKLGTYICSLYPIVSLPPTVAIVVNFRERPIVAVIFNYLRFYCGELQSISYCCCDIQFASLIIVTPFILPLIKRALP